MKILIKKLIPNWVKDFYHYSWALAGAVYYGFPSRKIKVIGVTGTGGKSTVIALTGKILEESGYKVASSSSIVFKWGDKQEENKYKMTMPGRLVLQKFLNRAVAEKCDYAIIETTSEGIKQFRHKFIDFNIAVVTNLNPEHIEAHKGFENYKKEKGKLFKIAKEIHIINLDDNHKDFFLGFPTNRIITYGVENKNADIVAENIIVKPEGSTFTVDGVDFSLQLLCEFNIYNALAAIAIGVSQGVSLSQCSDAIKKVGQVAGRTERVIDNPFYVFVDYAFVPISLEKVYQFLKPEKGKLICVLGACGGGRDSWKRPVLGTIADKYGNYIIVTNEDPYDENPQEIIDQVSSGIKDTKKLFKIFDRREGIRKALELAKAGDTIIITGKGCEPWICWERGRKEAWDDRAVIREEFKRIKNKGK
ncbi:MAG: UDP-N-acetylmuramoyl-L-alanyl-D-glutamate--2,6-diaminopimelate ligase [Candidatus Paceibacterota bacterium]|jgi:UDP-N-acetylmuramoyl-L-alanyl-D-glutamate--2,6-diaminopimelate ligase|nr:UDP-N-acetylmuramoyl-L-alanyl-D-glutamate--2,6-diaminopimelate ligase [bacterium]